MGTEFAGSGGVCVRKPPSGGWMIMDVGKLIYLRIASFLRDRE